MSERIGENIESADFEGAKKEAEQPLEKIEDVVSQAKKEELLQNIYKGGAVQSASVVDDKDSAQKKQVSILIKEYFSVGAEKTIKKVRKLGAYFLDMFHDELTKKNRGDKGGN